MRHKNPSRPALFPLAVVFALSAISAVGWYLTQPDAEFKAVRTESPIGMRAAAPKAPVESENKDMVGDAHDMSFLKRQAIRMKARLRRDHSFLPSVSDLTEALAERNTMLQKEVTVTFTTQGADQVPYPWTIRLADYQSWIRFVPSITSPRFEIDRKQIEQFLKDAYITELPHPRDAKVISIATDQQGVTRVQTDKLATAGYVYDTANAVTLIADALRNDQKSIQWAVEKKQGTLEYHDNGKVYKLTLLASGLSDYTNSPDNRVWNVKKVFNERLQGVIVKQGQSFSFVDTLGGPVTLDAGWKEALGLFGGGAALTPGAGICQGATTVYRSALLAGVKIVHKRNHSLFVDHYEKYGIGLDATIFPGFHDLQFQNDTPGPIILQTYLKGDDAVVNMYGVDDGRSVTMKGPYFATNAGKELRRFGRAGLTQNQIAWTRTVTNADGTSNEELIVASYAKPLWRSLVTPYVGTNKALTELHSAAPTPAR